MTEKTCPTCQNISMAPEGKIREYNYWFLEHVGEPIPVKGWLILRLKRHGEGVTGMDSKESEELCQILDTLPKTLKEASGAENIYICSFNEAVPHLHFHFIPRYSTEARRTIDFFLLQNEVKAGKAEAVSVNEVIPLIKDLKEKL